MANLRTCSSSWETLLRGHGRCHVVVSVRRSDGRFVWRIQKAYDKDGSVDFDIVSNFIFQRKIMLPLFHESVVSVPKLVRLERKLFNTFNLPLENSISLPSRFMAMEMDDLCFFNGADEKAVAIEVKPKQGHFQKHLACISSYCSNCLLHLNKKHFVKMYDFCPLDLYSMQFERVLAAFDALLKVPRNNLKVFLNGRTIFANYSQWDESGENALEHYCSKSKRLTFSHLLAELFTSSQSRVRLLMVQILQLQMEDALGPFGIVKWIDENLVALDEDENLNNWLGIFENVKDAKELDMLKKCIIASSVRDCSIMVTLRIVEGDNVQFPEHCLRISCGCFLKYAVRVIDLDMKSPKKLIRYARRLREAIENVKRDKSILRKTCHSKLIC